MVEKIVESKASYDWLGEKKAGKLVEKQALFCRVIADFIQKAYEKGYLLTFGEAWRPDFVAQYYAKNGFGIKNSLHCARLAVDFNAFYKGKWLSGVYKDDIPHLEILGHLWESLDPKAAWGGRFKDKDYNHYSFLHNGVR